MDEVGRMEVLREMLLTEGWQLVEKFIHEKIIDCRSRLETCDLDYVIRIREQIQTYKSVLQYVEDTIEEGIINMPF